MRSRPLLLLEIVPLESIPNRLKRDVGAVLTRRSLAWDNIAFAGRVASAEEPTRHVDEWLLACEAGDVQEGQLIGSTGGENDVVGSFSISEGCKAILLRAHLWVRVESVG